MSKATVWSSAKKYKQKIDILLSLIIENTSKSYLFRYPHANDYKIDTGKGVLAIVRLHTRYAKWYRWRYAKLGAATLSVSTLTFPHVFPIADRRRTVLFTYFNSSSIMMFNLHHL